MSIIITILILLSVLAEATLFPIPLALLTLILYSTKGLSFNVILAAALGGGLLDIMTLRPYGITVLIFLGTVFIIQRYSRKVETYRLIYLIPVTALTIGAYSRYFYHEFVPQILVSLVIVLIYSFLSRKKPERYELIQ